MRGNEVVLQQGIGFNLGVVVGRERECKAKDSRPLETGDE